jgi:formyl-CoA transferase
MGVLPMHNIVPRLSQTPGRMRFPAPALGEHNDEIYGELGLRPGDIGQLREAGVI